VARGAAKIAASKVRRRIAIRRFPNFAVRLALDTARFGDAPLAAGVVL